MVDGTVRNRYVFAEHYGRKRGQIMKEIVIKLTDNCYKRVVDYKEKLPVQILEAIRHGTRLPKGHGRLIDADELKNYCQIGLENVKPLFKTEKYRKLAIDITQGIIADVDEMGTIIEADKEN